MKESFASAAFKLLNVILFPVVLLSAAPAFAGELRLIMFEQPGCAWCARWTKEIGPIWPKTAEAEAAPLTHLDLHAPLPDDVVLARPAAFTPTFVLLDDGVEVNRIEGYPGEDFFWGLLGMMIEEALTAG